jgi:hypothetical protein
MKNKYSDQGLEVLAAIGEYLVAKLASRNGFLCAVYE